jgi:lysophospholipase L1-like esterase
MSLLIRTLRIGAPILFGLALLEAALRIYNPLPFRVRGDQIVLPVRQSYTFTNRGARKLPAITHHTKNSFGFRGPDPPSDWSTRFTLLTIGGSTTECLFLSDGTTWTDQLARRLSAIRPDAWVNNAGLDGQSTFGHLTLVRNFVAALHPSMLLFLVGANDVERGDPSGFDAALTPDPSRRLHRVLTVLADHSEVVAIVENLLRALQWHRAGFGHGEVDLSKGVGVEVHQDENDVILATHREKYLGGYRRRLSQLVEFCRRSHIEPVLVTQPALFGDAIDPTTHLDLRSIQVGGRGNALLEWQLLELYNDVTRAVGADAGVLVIDLAREMPKDSRYYYDFLHFTNEGAILVGDIIFKNLQPHLPPRH